MIREGRPRRGNSTGRLVVGNCAPDCALTGVYPRQTPSLTGRHGERSPGGQVVETTAENVIRYVSTLLQRIAFQACLIDHSSISPFRINHLRTRDRGENDLCPDCALTLSASPHILTGYARSRVHLEQRCKVNVERSCERRALRDRNPIRLLERVRSGFNAVKFRKSFDGLASRERRRDWNRLYACLVVCGARPGNRSTLRRLPGPTNWASCVGELLRRSRPREPQADRSCARRIDVGVRRL